MVYETTSKKVKIIYPKRKCLTCLIDMELVSKSFNNRLGLSLRHLGVGGLDYECLVHYRCSICKKMVYMRYEAEEEFGQ